MKFAANRFVVLGILLSSAPLFGQLKYEITPLVGYRWGGTIDVEQPSTPNYDTHLRGSISYGIAGGIRIEEDGLIEFRWMHQNSRLFVKQDPLAPPVVTPYAAGVLRAPVTLDHFLGDFTHEFTVEGTPALQPFITASVGAARLSAPESSAMRFAFGFGAGLKIFPKPRWGFRFKVEYLPMVMHTELQTLVCSGGCIVALNGGVMNQFEVSFGPAFRF